MSYSTFVTLVLCLVYPRVSIASIYAGLAYMPNSSYLYPHHNGMAALRIVWVRPRSSHGNGFYPYNLKEMSYIHMGAECHGGLVSGNAKGNKDIQKGMQKTAGTKAKRNEQNTKADDYRFSKMNPM